MNEGQINRIIKGVFDGKYSKRKLPTSFYKEQAEKLTSGVMKGWGKRVLTDKTKGLEGIKSMRENVQMFSAAKTYHMTRELEAAKKSNKGDYKAYKEQAKNIVSKYENWGKAEYDTTIAQAQQAKKWDEIIENSDLYPKLRYSTVGGDVCDICRPLDNIVLPISHPFWKKYYPANHYNCLCIAIQEPSSTRVSRKIPDVENKMSPVFIGNSGISKEVFNKNHPYFDVLKSDRGFAKKNFGLPIYNSLYIDDVFNCLLDEPIQI